MDREDDQQAREPDEGWSEETASAGPPSDEEGSAPQAPHTPPLGSPAYGPPPGYWPPPGASPYGQGPYGPAPQGGPGAEQAGGPSDYGPPPGYWPPPGASPYGQGPYGPAPQSGPGAEQAGGQTGSGGPPGPAYWAGYGPGSPPPGGQARGKRGFGWRIIAAATAAVLAWGAIAGFIGNAMGASSAGRTDLPALRPRSGATSPGGSGTSPGAVPGFTGPGVSPFGEEPGSGSSSNGAGPSDSSAIAKRVDPGLVDINTTIDYGVAQGAGTGMVLTSNGEVLTNNHVIEGATSISVTDVGNGRTYAATVVGYDRSQDVAVLQLKGASGLKTVSLGDSSKVASGEQVVAIGNAGGAGGTPTYAGGTVTGTGRSVTASDQLTGTNEHLTGMIATNANVVAGDSGGPLVNTSGQVVGMDTAGSGYFRFASQSSTGFAVPINTAASLARQMEAGRSSSTVHVGATAFLGVEIPSAGRSTSAGARISGVVSGSPASGAGLSPGDVITSVAGHSVTSGSSLQGVMVNDVSAGQKVQVQYTDTSGHQQTTTVTLASGPPA